MSHSKNAQTTITETDSRPALGGRTASPFATRVQDVVAVVEAPRSSESWNPVEMQELPEPAT